MAATNHHIPDGWRFVVDAGVQPAPDALGELEAARALAPDAVVLAAKVVLPDGSLDPGSEPWPRILDKQEAVDAVRHRLLAIRAARPGAMLVRAGVEPTLTGTAAALAAGRGYLAPRAVATRTAPARPDPLRARLALLRAPHWTREERLLQLYGLLRG